MVKALLYYVFLKAISCLTYILKLFFLLWLTTCLSNYVIYSQLDLNTYSILGGNIIGMIISTLYCYFWFLTSFFWGGDKILYVILWYMLLLLPNIMLLCICLMGPSTTWQNNKVLPRRSANLPISRMKNGLN